MPNEDLILVGIILTVIILLEIVVVVLDRFFPKNKISKFLEKMHEWIKENIKI